MADKMKHEIARMTITPAENGGHTVEHHYKAKPVVRRGNMGGGFDSGYIEPTTHTFGHKSEEHVAMAQHMAKHLGLKVKISPMTEEADEEKVSPGIHAKVAKMEAKKGKGGDRYDREDAEIDNEE